MGATLKRREGSERGRETSFKGIKGLSLWAQPALGIGLNAVEFIRKWT
jgi:hypothetical protein